MTVLRNQTNKSSSSIPIPESHANRSQASYERQLEHAKKLYEWRAGMMYHRVVNGMIRRWKEVGCHPTINQSVHNVIQTRLSLLPESDASEYTSGSSTTGSASDDDDEWLLYEGSHEEQADFQPSFSIRGSQGFQSAMCHEWSTQPCPALRMDVEQADVSSIEDDIIFEMDL